MLSASQQLFVKTRASIVPRAVPPLIPRYEPVPVVKARRPRPAGFKQPYVIRPFIRDAHVARLQHLENRGMYKEELDLERARFPRFTRTLTVQTDGSLTEREFEFAVPPVVVLFRDRQAAYAEYIHAQRRLGRSTLVKAPTPAKPQEAPAGGACNVLCFPYCVPSTTAPRKSKLQ
jgi:hypothetical protein